MLTYTFEEHLFIFSTKLEFLCCPEEKKKKKRQGRIVFLTLKSGEISYKLVGNWGYLWSYLQLFIEIGLYRVKFTNLIGEISFSKAPDK